MNRPIFLRCLLSVACLLPLLALTACRSSHVQITVENRTGAAIQLLEVDYPSASFGADQIAAGSDFHYRIQVQGSSPVKVSYTGPGAKQFQATGPELADHAQGSLTIVLLPGGKVEFHPNFSVKQ